MPESDAQRHGLHARTVAIVVAAIGVVVALVCAAVAGMAHLWGTPMQGANAPMDLRIPEPRLQSAPQYDSARHLAREDRILEGYAWLDRDKTIARIPVEEAMRMLANARRGDAPAAPSTGPVSAAPVATPALEQRAGTLLPLDARFRDEAGAERALSRYFENAPVVLVFGYYRCPNLCTTLMESVLTSLAAAQLETDAYRVVAISVDPRESAADAAGKARAYKAAYDAVPLHLLTGDADQSARVARAAGLAYAFDAAVDEYAHPLAVLVVTPEGRISRYFAGVAFDPRALRLALIEASHGRIGALTERVFLRCAHYDPRTGRYTLAAMTFVRGGCVLVGGGLGVWLWRRRRSGRWTR